MSIRSGLFVHAGLVAALMLSGCLTGGSTDEAQAPGGPNPPGSGNSAPVISGNPNSSAVVGSTYTFTPTASDADGDPLEFSVQNLPSWASFDAGDGSVSGVPGSGDVGTYANIQISVNDGDATSSLAAFSIVVNQTGTGSATLSWTPPTQNMDGSPLDDLAGYRIYYGLSQGNYPNSVTVDNPGVSSFVVENLAPDTYYFVATAVNNSGIESNYSNVATKIVN